MKKSIILLLTCILLSSCTSTMDGIFERAFYRSDVKIAILREDGSLYYSKSPKSSYALLKMSTKWNYFQYLYDNGPSLLGTPRIKYEYSDEMIKKLLIFITWAKLPYEERLKTLNETQNSLPNNNPNNSNSETSTTDFILFHDENKNPYLTLIRKNSWFFSPYYISISDKDAKTMIDEIMYFKYMGKKYRNEHQN